MAKVELRARPEINALIRSKISEPYQGVKVTEFDHLSPDDPLVAALINTCQRVARTRLQPDARDYLDKQMPP